VLTIKVNHSPYRLDVPQWSWPYGSWIYNYLCNQCLLLRTVWVRIPLKRGVLDTTLCHHVSQWLAAGWWFSPGTPVFSTNKADLYDITEILLRVALTTTTLTHDPIGKIDPYMQVKCVSCLTITNAVDHISLDSVKTYHKMEILTRKLSIYDLFRWSKTKLYTPIDIVYVK
jgi:hypothetical protein